jgi:hypothetical protein
MANLISTDSGHHYDLDDVQSGLRYIAEQRLGAVPSHVLSLVYNAIYHIEKQKAIISELREGLKPNVPDQTAGEARSSASPCWAAPKEKP